MNPNELAKANPYLMDKATGQTIAYGVNRTTSWAQLASGHYWLVSFNPADEAYVDATYAIPGSDPVDYADAFKLMHAALCRDFSDYDFAEGQAAAAERAKTLVHVNPSASLGPRDPYNPDYMIDGQPIHHAADDRLQALVDGYYDPNTEQRGNTRDVVAAANELMRRKTGSTSVQAGRYKWVLGQTFAGDEHGMTYGFTDELPADPGQALVAAVRAQEAKLGRTAGFVLDALDKGRYTITDTPHDNANGHFPNGYYLKYWRRFPRGVEPAPTSAVWLHLDLDDADE